LDVLALIHYLSADLQRAAGGHGLQSVAEQVGKQADHPAVGLDRGEGIAYFLDQPHGGRYLDLFQGKTKEGFQVNRLPLDLLRIPPELHDHVHHLLRVGLYLL
jgi:hypothetical protein